MHFACRHIKSDGVRCDAAAMRGSHFCYYHSRNRSRARLDAIEDLVIPIPEDTASIRTSIAQTLNALISKRIDAKTAGLVLYGLQLAVQSIPKGFSLPPDTVREVTQSADGDELAPAACLDAISDCSGCPHADTCERCEIDPEDDEDEQDGAKTGFSLTPALKQKLLQTLAGLQRGG
jgi:hypothetical protein